MFVPDHPMKALVFGGSEEEEIMTAESCQKFKEGTPYCLEPDNYCPSAYTGDYSPSNPWDAPGMSIYDFI